MDRRSLFKSLAAAPALLLSGAPTRPSPAPARQDHAGQDLHATDPQSALQPEQHDLHRRDRHGDHGDWRRRIEGHARAVRGHAHRQGPVQDRGDLAGDVHRLVLPARAREDARHGRDGHGALGHQGQGAQAAGARAARRHRAQPLRVLRDDVHAAAGAGREALSAARPRQGRDGRRVSRLPHGRRRPPDRQRLQPARGRQPRHRAVQGSPRGRRTERRLVHRLPPALRPQRRAARVSRHRGVRAATSSRIPCATSTPSWTCRNCAR